MLALLHINPFVCSGVLVFKNVNFCSQNLPPHEDHSLILILTSGAAQNVYSLFKKIAGKILEDSSVLAYLLLLLHVSQNLQLPKINILFSFT